MTDDQAHRDRAVTEASLHTFSPQDEGLPEERTALAQDYERGMLSIQLNIQDAGLTAQVEISHLASTFLQLQPLSWVESIWLNSIF